MNDKEKRNSIRENIVYRNARVIVVALLFCMFALMNGQTVFATESSGGNLVPGNSISADKSVKEKSGKIVTENGKYRFMYIINHVILQTHYISANLLAKISSIGYDSIRREYLSAFPV